MKVVGEGLSMKSAVRAILLTAAAATALSACGAAQTTGKSEAADTSIPGTAIEPVSGDASNAHSSQDGTKTLGQRLDPSSPEFTSWLRDKTKEVEDFVGSARLPISIKTYLSEFLDTKEMVAELATKQEFRLSSGATESRFIESFCEPLTWTDELSLKPISFHDVEWDLCTPPGFNMAGTSPDFSIYWIRNRLGPRDESYKETFPFPWLRQCRSCNTPFGKPFVITWQSLLTSVAFTTLSGVVWVSETRKLTPEVRDLVAKRLRRIADLFAIARNACSRASCSAKPGDFSTANDRLDLNGFVGTSPMRNLVGYDNLELWEIRALEFAARRHTEGGAPLVTEYIAIANDAAVILET
jgi:hypothetical protein